MDKWFQILKQSSMSKINSQTAAVLLLLLLRLLFLFLDR